MSTSAQQANDEFAKVTAEAKASFGKLNSNQLNWKPGKDRWSIAQCLQHLIIGNGTYFPQFEEIISGKHHPSFYQKLTFISNFIGKNMVRDLGPSMRKTFKNPAIFTPSQSDIAGSIVSDFEKHQQKLSNYMQRLQNIDLHNTIIYSPVAKVFIYNLADAINVLVVHEQRHLLQAKRVMEDPNFPK